MPRRATLGILATALAFALLAPAAAAAATRLIAPASVCPNQTDPRATPAAQEEAMLCLVNDARRGHGLPAFAANPALARAADRKSADILRCDSFSHEACGRDFTYWIERSGYRACAAAENIAWGSGGFATVRSIFRLWMHSPGHRANILGDYEEIGIGLRLGSLEGSAGAHVWAQDFGSPC